MFYGIWVFALFLKLSWDFLLKHFIELEVSLIFELVVIDADIAESVVLVVSESEGGETIYID